MKSVEIPSQPTSLSDLVELAKREAGVLLLQSGQPVARVMPVPDRVRTRTAPLHPGAMQTSDDFDAPLPDDFWLGQI